MIEALLDFWFGPLDEAGLCAKARRQALFRADPEFDAALGERFGADVEAALVGAKPRIFWRQTIRFLMTR